MNGTSSDLPVNPCVTPDGSQETGSRDMLAAAPVRWHRMTWRQWFRYFHHAAFLYRQTLAYYIAGRRAGEDSAFLAICDPTGRVVGLVNRSHPESAVTLNLWARAWDIGTALIAARQMLVDSLPEHQVRPLIRRIDIALDGITHPAIHSPVSQEVDRTGAQGGQ